MIISGKIRKCLLLFFISQLYLLGVCVGFIVFPVFSPISELIKPQISQSFSRVILNFQLLRKHCHGGRKCEDCVIVDSVLDEDLHEQSLC